MKSLKWTVLLVLYGSNVVAMNQLAVSKKRSQEYRRNRLYFLAQHDMEGEVIARLCQTNFTLYHGDECGNNALHRAAFCGNLKAAEILLQAGAPANVQNWYGKTAAHKAVQANNDNTLAMLELLKQYDADFSLTDMYNNTLLHEAASLENKELIEYLKDFGIPADAQNNDNLTYQDILAIAQMPQAAHLYVCAKQLHKILFYTSKLPELDGDQSK